MFGVWYVGGTVIKVYEADKVPWILRTNFTRTMLYSIMPPPPGQTLLVAVCKNTAVKQ